MEQYVIKGGNRLKGTVEIGGAKNAALPILAAAIMADEPVRIDNMPDVDDTNMMLEAIISIGAKVTRIDAHSVIIDGVSINSLVLSEDFIKRIRASYYFLGALLGKYKKAKVALPGGCNIGSRPIDLHLKGFRALGAEAEVRRGMVEVETSKLTGSNIFLDRVSVGATINIMMAASLADGICVIENAAKEPHIVDVANFLNSMGADIRGAGTDIIRIRGVKKLKGTTYSIIPDQIEAGTFMFAAAITHGDITVTNVIPKHLEAISSKIEDMGCTVEEFDDCVRVVGPERLKSTQVVTQPYPGYPTDMQPQITSALTISKGISIVIENIFENRFKYVAELVRMGARIRVESNTAIIEGVTELTGARISAPDLRAGAALVLVGLAAEGITIIDDIKYIKRGYEKFDVKLRNLGAIIEITKTEKEIQKFKLKVS